MQTRRGSGGSSFSARGAWSGGLRPSPPTCLSTVPASSFRRRSTRRAAVPPTPPSGAARSAGSPRRAACAARARTARGRRTAGIVRGSVPSARPRASACVAVSRATAMAPCARVVSQSGAVRPVGTGPASGRPSGPPMPRSRRAARPPGCACGAGGRRTGMARSARRAWTAAVVVAVREPLVRGGGGSRDHLKPRRVVAGMARLRRAASTPGSAGLAAEAPAQLPAGRPDPVQEARAAG